MNRKGVHKLILDQPDSVWDYYHGKIRCLRRKILGLNVQKNQLSKKSLLTIIDDLFDEVDFARTHFDRVKNGDETDEKRKLP